MSTNSLLQNSKYERVQLSEAMSNLPTATQFKDVVPEDYAKTVQYLLDRIYKLVEEVRYIYIYIFSCYVIDKIFIISKIYSGFIILYLNIFSF
jgi:hypothetical protein